jgi:hypothetical protein
MPRRVTVTALEAAIRCLNDITGSPAEPYTVREGEVPTPNAGNYHLSRAYGGFALHQMAEIGTGTRDVFYSGHIPARDLLSRIHAYVHGVDKGREVARTVA